MSELRRLAARIDGGDMTPASLEEFRVLVSRCDDGEALWAIACLHGIEELAGPALLRLVAIDPAPLSIVRLASFHQLHGREAEARGLLSTIPEAAKDVEAVLMEAAMATSPSVRIERCRRAEALDPGNGTAARWLALHSAEHPDAPPGKAAKYARRERERRFLLRSMPFGAVRTQLLVDRYFDGTRLRLRRSSETAEGLHVTTCKLTQKVPTADGSPGLITTIYLSPEEHEALSGLPGRTLSKTRTFFAELPTSPSRPPSLCVDAFDPPLHGLFVAEAEFDSDQEKEAFVPPTFAVAEITRDPRLTGGRLASMTRESLREILATLGVALE